MTRGLSPQSQAEDCLCFSWFIVLFYGVSVLSPAIHNVFHTPMARYSLFVLKVPLNNNKPQQTIVKARMCPCVILVHGEQFWTPSDINRVALSRTHTSAKAQQFPLMYSTPMCGRVVKTLDLRSTARISASPLSSASCASVANQYNLVPANGR